MPKLAIVATIEVAPERRDQLLPLLMAHRGRCLKDEPGTLQFEVLVPREDDTKVLLYEVYRDDAAFDVHLNGPHIERVREEAAGMILKLYGTRCLYQIPEAVTPVRGYPNQHPFDSTWRTMEVRHGYPASC